MTKETLIYIFILIGNLSFSQTGYLKIDILDLDEKKEFLYKQIKVIGIDTISLEFNPFESENIYKLKEGIYKLKINDSFLKDLDNHKRLIQKYQIAEVKIVNKDTLEYSFKSTLDTIFPDQIHYLEIFDLKKELLCHDNECFDLNNRKYGVFISSYSNGIGIYTGIIYSIYVAGKEIIEIKTENNKKTYLKVKHENEVKINTLNEAYDYDKVISFLKLNFNDGKLKEDIKFIKE